MGIAEDAQFEKKASKRERAKQSRGRRAQTASVDWAGFGWAEVQALTEELVAVGGAVRIGATRDGGAWAFGIYHGDDYATEYVRPAEDFTQAVQEICEAWLGAKTTQHWWERVIALRAQAAR